MIEINRDLSLISLLLLIGFYYLSFGTENQNYIDALDLLYRIHNDQLGYHNITKQEQRNMIERDYLKLTHPETVLEDMYIYRTQAFGDSQRNTIRKKYFDSQPLHETHQVKPMKEHQDKKNSKYTTIHQVSFMKVRNWIYRNYPLTEKTMKMAFPESLYNKVVMALYSEKYHDKLRRNNHTEQCLKDAQFFRNMYRLDDPKQCEEFFRIANPLYMNQSNPNEVYKYVKKNNMHDQQGTELLFKAVFHQVAEQYDYGKNCTRPPLTLMMQEYIDDPLLLEGRKFDIRLHIVVTSTNPFIIYLYRKFYLMKCLYEFNHNEFKNQSHICSAGYQRKMIRLLKSQNNQEELAKILPPEQITEPVTYEQFADKLIKEGKIKDRSWIDTHMIPELEKRFAHYFQSWLEQDGTIRTPRVGEYTACEIAFDNSLHPWFLECTTNPNMIPGPTGAMGPFQYGLHDDGFPMLIAYARQKYHKIKNFVEKRLMKLVRDKSPDDIYDERDEKLFQDVENLLREDVIVDKKFDAAFHRVNVSRAFESCYPGKTEII